MRVKKYALENRSPRGEQVAKVSNLFSRKKSQHNKFSHLSRHRIYLSTIGLPGVAQIFATLCGKSH